MELNLLQITSAFMVLFGIIDILGSIPLIIRLQGKGETIQSTKITLIAYGIMVLFLFAGDFILQVFHVDIQSFAVAGALIIFLMGMEMVLDVEFFKNAGPSGSSSIVPLAFPLVAGPGSFTALVSLQAEYDTLNIVIALTLNLIFVYFVLRSTKMLERILGEAGIYIMRKFFGIILLAIAVKLFTTNIHSLFGG